MKFLIDMNLSARWVDEFAAAGFEAVHWSALGAANTKDPIIMDYALRHDYIVLTQDLDFGSMLAFYRYPKPSVIQLRAENAGPESLGAQVLNAVIQFSEELGAGALITVEQHKVRVRILPFA